jgi:outer membrane protein assembly factor BamB
MAIFGPHRVAQSATLMIFLAAACFDGNVGQTHAAPADAAPADAAPSDAAAAKKVAGEWPQFLGPNRNGLSAETGLLDRWPEGGPKTIWRAKGGVGMSGLAISRGRLLTLVQREAEQRLVALDTKTGDSIWQTTIVAEYKNAMADGPRATPTIVGGQVFVYTGEGVLAAVDFKTGKVQWSHAVAEELGGKTAEYGMACSPLVVGEQVIVTAGAPGATVAAYDINSGKLVWKTGDDPAGYSSPAHLTVGGKSQIVAFTGNSAIGIAPSTGELLWRYPYETNFACNIATPLEFKGQVFLSSGENHGSVLLALSPATKTADNPASFEAKPVWESQGTKSVLRNEWQTSMLLDGYLYGMDNVGGAGPITHLTCVDAATGKRKWQVARFGKGNLICADGKLFIVTMKGELVVARATPDKYDEIGRATVLESVRQAPALSEGRLYMRDDKNIVCVDVRK